MRRLGESCQIELPGACDLRHIVMKDRLLAAIDPLDSDARPIRFNDRAVVVAI